LLPELREVDVVDVSNRWPALGKKDHCTFVCTYGTSLLIVGDMIKILFNYNKYSKYK